MPYLNFIDIEPANFISVPFQDHARHIQVRLRREEGSRPPGHPRGARLPQELQLLHWGQPGAGQHGRYGHHGQRQAGDHGRGDGGQPEQDHGTKLARRGSDQGEQNGRPLSFSKVFWRGARAESLLARFIACLPFSGLPLVLLSLFVRRIILSAHRPKVFSLLVWLVARINRVAKSTKVGAEINYWDRCGKGESSFAF